MAASLTLAFSRAELNIEQQINTSRGEIAYTVLDLQKVDDPAGLQVRRVG
jgi:D-3-phosphoglycerate dehydrogenase